MTCQNGEGRPGANRAANSVSNDTVSIARRIDRFTHDSLLEVFLSAERTYWLRRAKQFEAARPAPGEFHGGADRKDLSEQWQRLNHLAQACRARAKVSPVDSIKEDIANVLLEFEETS